MGMQVSGNLSFQSCIINQDIYKGRKSLALYLGLPRTIDPGEGAYPHGGKGVTHWLQQQRRLHSVPIHQPDLYYKV